MSPFLTILIIAIVVVGLFVLAISITLIFKGHDIDSEIGTNENMRKLGIKCAAQQFRDEDRALPGEDICDLPLDCHSQGCASCAHEEATKQGE